MKIGTIETIDETEKNPRPGVGRSGGSRSGGNKGGGGRGPGGGGSDGPKDDDQDLDPQRFVPGKSRILTGFLLVVVTMTFGGLIAAYIVIATNNVAEWQPFALPIQLWISTAIILASSITYHLGKNAIERNEQPIAKKWMIATTVLGAMFISSQLLSWLALSARGLYVASNPYAGFYYILTAVHAVHVLGGIIALGSILLRIWTPAASAASVAKRITFSQVVGWYWHFMGALWIVLFVLLGFWK
jgi:cytochrome c oxidase subunit 3